MRDISPFGSRAATLLLACVIVSSGGASAQGRVYKQVNPDGSVTFTDKPPPGQEPPPPAMAPATPAAIAPPAEANNGVRTQRKAGGAKQAIRKRDGEPSASDGTFSQGALDPAVDKGIVVLMGLEALVSEFRDLCLRTLPTSFKRYDGAAETWKSRHAAVLGHYLSVLKENFSPADVAAMRAAAQNQSRTMLAPVSAAAAAHRIKWCDSNAVELETGKMDLAPNHVNALMAYRPKR